MRLHVVQKDIGATSHSAYLERAAIAGVDLICFGELSTTGCLYESRPVPPLESTLEELAPYTFGIMLGMPCRQEGHLYNMYLYYRRKTYYLYRKIHLFAPMNEDQVYTPGAKPGLFETEHGRLGVAICYDIRFPELFTRLKALGAQTFIIPAAFPRVRIDDWKGLLVQRAIDAEVPVIGINSVGDDGTTEFGGCSAVVDGRGRVLAQAGQTEEKVLEVEM